MFWYLSSGRVFQDSTSLGSGLVWNFVERIAMVWYPLKFSFKKSLERGYDPRPNEVQTCIKEGPNNKSGIIHQEKCIRKNEKKTRKGKK